jgi:hypothetical protein
LKHTVNSILTEYAQEFLARYKTSDYTKKIIRAIIDCRTEALGGHIQKCDHCGEELTLYNSCRNRHCPQCQFMKKEKWIEDKKNEVLPYQYFHAVFTLPDLLNPIIYRNKRVTYKLLFDKIKETLLSVSEEEKYFGARIGFFAILHTWGQKLNLHPHIHCVIPGGGYSEKKCKWKSCPPDYLFPIKVLSKRFRSLFLCGLKELYKNNHLYLKNSKYKDKKEFQKLIDHLFNIEWIVYLKESFNNPESVIKYLSSYTHRIALSNHRILGVKDRVVTFSYKDYSDNNKKKIMKIDVMEFISRFLLHIIPYRFVRIRYYGLLSLRNKKKSLEDCYAYYEIDYEKKEKRTWQEIYKDITGNEIDKCPKCKIGKMIEIKKIEKMKCRSGP